MNLQYLGDALDHWKGSVFESLQKAQVLKGFQVDPMATDAHAWKLEDRVLFARLLRVEESEIVHHTYNLCKDRDRYFSEIPSVGDLFIDPDTGIVTRYVKHVEQYLRPQELFNILEAHQRRIVVVYQHVRAKKTRVRIEEVLKRLREEQKPFYCTSYESGTVALLFFALEKDRVIAVQECFQRFLGVHALNRVGFWNGNPV